MQGWIRHASRIISKESSLLLKVAIIRQGHLLLNLSLFHGRFFGSYPLFTYSAVISVQKGRLLDTGQLYGNLQYIDTVYGYIGLFRYRSAFLK